jgi:hypothetical protein
MDAEFRIFVSECAHLVNCVGVVASFGLVKDA